MAEKLLPCPFCGSDRIRILPQPDGWMSVDCTVCGATKKAFTKFKKQITAEWNLRPRFAQFIKITPKAGSSYEVHYLNNVKLGEFHMEVDGFYVFEPKNRGGYWPEHMLMALGMKLKEMNAEWEQQIEKELK